MDYLCELPNDAARRRALNSLPPDLNSTYERILGRVNESNPETQKLVRRALRWIANDTHFFALDIKALCEVVSIEFEDTRRNLEAIPDEFEILRWCSSLVRKSANGEELELSHFTVKEFLTHIESPQDTSIGAYRIDPTRDELIFGKVCLIYLNFQDFDQKGPYSRHAVERRFHQYPFRPWAVNFLFILARKNLGDAGLFSLVQKLLSPSKPNTLISWAHDFFMEDIENEEELGIANSGFAEATALHYAVMLGLKEVCSWLIRSGCDVNRNTNFGTPLHCALLGRQAFIGRIQNRRTSFFKISIKIRIDIVDLLLESGADSNCCYDAGIEKLSPLFMALSTRALSTSNLEVAMRLLDKGGILDSRCLDVLETSTEPDDIRRIVESTTDQNLPEENHSRLIQLALRAKTSSVTRLMQRDKDLPRQKTHDEDTLRTAAEFGQMEIVRGLLEDQKLDVDAADESTGLTALHHAVRSDQLGVAQILIDRGADSSRSDRLGRTALHHSALGRGVCCLQFFLQQDVDISLRDLENMTVWHLAAQEGNVQALSTLLSWPVDSALTVDLKASDGRTALLCASANQSKEAMRLLLKAGSSLTETASDGCSPLHYAALSGSVEGVEFLLGQAIDPCAVTHDGSSALHYAVWGDSENLAKIVHILLKNGADPCEARNDACTPLHNLVKTITETPSFSSERLDRLFTAGRTLLNKMLEKSRPAFDVKLGSELMYLACSQSFPIAHETVLALLKHGIDCNIPSASGGGRTALMAAAGSGNEALLSTLLLHGADPCFNVLGLNAVHCACFEDQKSILVRLRDTSIDWNSKIATTRWRTPRNVTALHIAARIEDSSVLKYLLNENLMSNVDALDSKGETPLLLAVRSRAPQNVSLLLSNGASTTIGNYSGQSVAHCAAEWGFEEAISEFIVHGSDLGLPNSRGLTPELVARKHGHTALAEVIMDYVNKQSGSCHTVLMEFCAA